MSKKIISYIGSAIAVCLLLASIFVIHRELQRYSIADIKQSFSAISTVRVGLAIAFTALGYTAMTGYDTLAFRYLQHPLAYGRIATTNFISHAFSNTIGFALLTGGAIRYKRYTAWGVSGWAVTQIIAFANISFWLGLFALGSIVFLVAPLTIPAAIPLPFATARPLGLIFFVIALSYPINSVIIKRTFTLKQHTFRFPPLPVALGQLMVGALDWAMAAAVLYALMPTDNMSYFGFLNVYLLAMAAGSASSVPGGVGVFETVILLLLATVVPGDIVLAALLAHRMIYYLLPFTVAALLLFFSENYSLWVRR